SIIVMSIFYFLAFLSFPYTTLFRSIEPDPELQLLYHRMLHADASLHVSAGPPVLLPPDVADFTGRDELLKEVSGGLVVVHGQAGDRKSTRLNSSHVKSLYGGFCS